MNWAKSALQRIWQSIQQGGRDVRNGFDAIKKWKPAQDWRQNFSFPPAHPLPARIPIGVVPEPARIPQRERRYL